MNNNNINNLNYTPFSFKEEDLQMLTKEVLITNILKFTDQVNKQCESIISIAKSYSNVSVDSVTSIDTNSNKFIKVLHHHKNKFESIGIIGSAFERLNKAVIRSKSEVLNKKGLYESSRMNYINENIKLHALEKVHDMFKNSIQQRELINQEQDDLKSAQLALKNRQRELRNFGLSVRLDDGQKKKKRNSIRIEDEEVLDRGIGGDGDGCGGGGSAYNNGVDEFMEDW
jgi:hypothetical protein